MAAAYLLLVAALLLAALGIWRLPCEGFGCMGIGVAWLAWVAAFFPVLGFGAWAGRRLSAARGFALACRVSWWLQLAVGLTLLLVWLVKRWV